MQHPHPAEPKIPSSTSAPSPEPTPGPPHGSTRVEVDIPRDLEGYLTALAKHYGTPVSLLVVDLLRNRALHREALQVAEGGASASEIALVDQRQQSKVGPRASARLPKPPRGGGQRSQDIEDKAALAEAKATRKSEIREMPRLARHPCRHCRVNAASATTRRGHVYPLCANSRIMTDECRVKSRDAQKCSGFRA